MPPVRVGLIGNFAHSATIDAAKRLMASDAVRSGAVQPVFAGLESLAWRSDASVEVLGPVATVEEFYRHP